jgi:hypothetical protein
MTKRGRRTMPAEADTGERRRRTDLGGRVGGVRTIPLRQWAQLLQGQTVVAVLDADERGPYIGMVVLQLANGEEIGVTAVGLYELAFGRAEPRPSPHDST